MIVKNPKLMENKETVAPAKNEDANFPHTEMHEEYNERTENKETNSHHNEEDGVRGSKTSGQGNHGSHYPRQG
jgi:hypothetical protein